MIPKIIHYCWFGNKEKPKKVLKLINGWKRLLPDYQFIEWNERNFDVFNACDYVKEAYQNGKWAFVSDYVRIYALNKVGGIYLDTDVELIKSFDNYLDNSFFVSYESEVSLCTAIIGSSKDNPILDRMLADYNKEQFSFSDKIQPNSERLLNYVESMNSESIAFNKEFQSNNIHIYPIDYFGAKDIHTYQLLKTDNTIAIHHLDATWYSNRKKFLRFCKKKVMAIVNVFRR